MPDFKMTYPYPIHNAKVGNVAVGEVITAKENPDAHFFVEVTPPESKKADPPAPADSKETP